MKNAIRFIATGLVISLASASFAQTNSSGEKITVSTELTGKNLVTGKNEVITAPESVTDKNRRPDFWQLRNQNPREAKKLLKERHQKFVQQRHENRRGDSKFEQFQNNHPQLANLFMNHRAAFVRMGVSPREVMHRATARRMTTR